MEEIVEAQHAELMSFAALPRHLVKQRDSLLSLQNVESLTDELAQLSQDLERLAISEGATISDSPVSVSMFIPSILDTTVGSMLVASSAALVRFSKAQQVPPWLGVCPQDHRLRPFLWLRWRLNVSLKLRYPHEALSWV